MNKSSLHFALSHFGGGSGVLTLYRPFCYTTVTVCATSYSEIPSKAK